MCFPQRLRRSDRAKARVSDLKKIFQQRRALRCYNGRLDPGLILALQTIEHKLRYGVQNAVHGSFWDYPEIIYARYFTWNVMIVFKNITLKQFSLDQGKVYITHS